jgi:hypothetical protein
MAKHLMAALLGLLVACGGSQPSTKQVDKAPAECAPTDCGAEPPISPAVCPEGAAISSSCTRAASGTCERKISCDGKDAAAAVESAPPQP